MIENLFTTELHDQLERCGDDPERRARQAERDWVELIEVVGELNDALKSAQAAGAKATDPWMLDIARKWQMLIDHFTGYEGGTWPSLERMHA